jgi:hypothetical protein
MSRSRKDDAFLKSGCTVEFHQIRPGKDWIAEDLEGHKPKAILVFDVGSELQKCVTKTLPGGTDWH